MSVYMPLDCDGFASALADYLEGEAPDAVRAAVEAHAAECAECGALLGDLRAIRHDAAALPALTPSRDLWSGIAERIDARVIPMERATRTIVPARRSWARPAIAAAALVVVTAGTTYFTMNALGGSPRAVASVQTAARGTGSAPAPSADSAPIQVATVNPPVPQSPDGSSASATGQAGAQRSAEGGTPAAVARRSAPAGTAAARLASAVNGMNEAEPVYDREISKLRAIVKTRRSQLDPRTIAVLEQSMAVIDSAIAQSRAALAKDPASGFLANQLNHSLEKKVELLRTAAMLPART